MAKHQLISLSGTNFWDVYNPNANNGSENIPEKYSNSIYHFIIVQYVQKVPIIQCNISSSSVVLCDTYLGTYIQEHFCDSVALVSFFLVFG